MDERERRKIIDQTLVQLEKQFGKGSILRLGSSNVVPVSVISTGSISIDSALGVGGLPRGRVTEVFGPESSGKTTIALHIVAATAMLQVFRFPQPSRARVVEISRLFARTHGVSV